VAHVTNIAIARPLRDIAIARLVQLIISYPMVLQVGFFAAE
jgi:hypothetical protein